MKDWQKRLIYAFFPKRCIYCDRVIRPEEWCCSSCGDDVPFMEDPVCAKCGRSKTLCRCKGHRRHFERCVAAMRYEKGADRAIRRLKHEEQADLIETMVHEMTAALRKRTDAAALDAVTFVPMRKAEYHQRGYNQSELLAKAIAEELGIPFRDLLVKCYDTKPQKSLAQYCRGGNVLGAFDASKEAADQRILLVDDLITTGSTLNECAKMLKIRGAVSVTALVFAATVPTQEETETTEREEG